MQILKFKKVNNYEYDLYLDNNEIIRLYEDVIIKEELLLSKKIDNLDLLLEKNNYYVAYHDSLKYLNKGLKSKLEVSNYLSKKYPNDIITKIMERLINNHYIDDEYYLESYIKDRIKLSFDGPEKIKYNLKTKGINVSDITDYFDSKLESNRIKDYINKQIKSNKKSNAMFKSKMLLNLSNLGYNRELINNALSSIKVDDTDQRKKEEEKIRIKLSKKYSGIELERKIKEKLYQKGYFN